MPLSRFTAPLEYLQAASRASLQSYELTRLNHAANLRQEIAALIDQWIQETSEALLARWMLDHHKSLQSVPMSPSEVVRTFVDPPTAPLPDCPPPPDVAPAPPRFAASGHALKGSVARKSPKQRLPSVG